MAHPGFELRRLSYALGAAVAGLDLREPCDEATIAALREAWLEHLLLHFPGQRLNAKELGLLAARFGEPEDPPPVPRSVVEQKSGSAAVNMLSNKTADGKPRPVYKNGLLWHTDRSMTLRPNSGTFLSCVETPQVGGDTMFANMYRAYETLSPAMQRLIDPLSTIQDGALLARSARIDRFGKEMREEHLRQAGLRIAGWRPTVQPLVRVHPETKRKALYVGELTRGIAGMTEEESRPLIDFLNRHAVGYELTYRHRWTSGDVIFFDNRCMLHIALCDYELQTDVRRIQSCSLKGEPSGCDYKESLRAESAV